MTTMENKENQEKGSANKTKQEISIPFLWEDAPGAPKRDWKPKREPLTNVPQPVKYIASIPFKWEEKPGTPLQCFSEERKECTVLETVPENKSLPLPPAYFTIYQNESYEESVYGDDYEDSDWISEFEFEFEALSIQSEDSFCSALANRVTQPGEAAASAVPLQNPFVIQQDNGYPEAQSSPESSSSRSSNATRNTSLRGDAFLQQLFPLYPPKSGFLNKPSNAEENGHVQQPERRLPTLSEHQKLVGDFRHSGVIRRPLTLGELIMQSRRRSYRRKAVQMKQNNLPKDFRKNQPQGCFNLGTSGGGLSKLFQKDLLTLKLS